MVMDKDGATASKSVYLNMSNSYIPEKKLDYLANMYGSVVNGTLYTNTYY